MKAQAGKEVRVMMKAVAAAHSAVFLHVSQPHGAVPDPSGSAPHQPGFSNATSGSRWPEPTEKV
jgi:hypothetical protein